MTHPRGGSSPGSNSPQGLSESGLSPLKDFGSLRFLVVFGAIIGW